MGCPAPRCQPFNGGRVGGQPGAEQPVCWVSAFLALKSGSPELPAGRGRGSRTTFPGRVSHGCWRPGPHSWLAEEPTPHATLPPQPPPTSHTLLPGRHRPPPWQPEVDAKAREQRAEAGVCRQGWGHLSRGGRAGDTRLEGSGAAAQPSGLRSRPAQ